VQGCVPLLTTAPTTPTTFTVVVTAASAVFHVKQLCVSTLKVFTTPSSSVLAPQCSLTHPAIATTPPTTFATTSVAAAPFEPPVGPTRFLGVTRERSRREATATTAAARSVKGFIVMRRAPATTAITTAPTTPIATATPKHVLNRLLHAISASTQRRLRLCLRTHDPHLEQLLHMLWGCMLMMVVVSRGGRGLP
jgi:hypothetical protein